MITGLSTGCSGGVSVLEIGSSLVFIFVNWSRLEIVTFFSSFTGSSEVPVITGFLF